MILRRENLLKFISDMDGMTPNSGGRAFDIYNDLSDIIGERYTTESDYEQLVDKILVIYGELEEDDYAPYMTIADIEDELGHKFILI